MAELSVRPNGTRRTLGDFLGFDPFATYTAAGYGFEIHKTESGYAVELAVAGFAPENIDVTLEDRVLTINGKNDRRTFNRSLLIPEEIDTDAIAAKVENGLLTISLNIHPKAQPRKISVEVAAH